MLEMKGFFMSVALETEMNSKTLQLKYQEKCTERDFIAVQYTWRHDKSSIFV